MGNETDHGELLLNISKSQGRMETSIFHIESHMATQNRRQTKVEERTDSLESSRDMFKGAGKLIGLLAVIIGIVVAVFKLT